MIDILLATYNGEAYLAAQLDSVFSQTDVPFRLMVRDDGSNDRTKEILADYASHHSNIEILSDDLGNIGASRSFMTLLAHSTAPLFMLCDQDDVWLPGKVDLSLAKIRELGETSPDGTPLLVFTDLSVVDETLAVLDPSFWHYQRLDPAIALDRRDLLAQNVVTGSTIIGNAAARQASLPFVLDEMMHDHWIAVSTAKNGHVRYLDTATVLYRQHRLNAEGARQAGARYLAASSTSLFGRMPFYRKAARHFGGVTAGQLMFRKIRLNLRRVFTPASR